MAPACAGSNDATARHGDRFVEIRGEMFPDGKSGSALIPVLNFARPALDVEIQGIAMCSGLTGLDRKRAAVRC